MRSLCIAAAILFVLTLTASAQCLTDFTKILPEPSIDYTKNYARSFSVHNDVLAVGIAADDSLGRITGIVYLYKRQADNSWKWFASKAPSDPMDALQFGVNVKLTENYLAVGAGGYGGSVYVFKKTAAEWTSSTEHFKLTVPSTVTFGAGAMDPIDISEDELTLAVVDQAQEITNTPFRMGAVYVYHRDAITEWNMDTPTRVIAPDDDVVDFGRTGVHILDDRIATASPFAPNGFGQAYIYRDATGEFDNMTLEARLTTTAASNTAYIGFSQFVFMDEGIIAIASINTNTTAKEGLVFFEKPTSGTWTTTEPTCSIDILTTSGFIGNTSMTSNGTDIYIGYKDVSGDSHFGIVSKGASGWCDATISEVIETVAKSSSPYSDAYGTKCSASGDNAVVGMTILPGKPNAALAIKAFHKSGATWNGSLLYSRKTTTAGHRYGTAVMTYENKLIVGAPYDGSVKSGGGAVYTYKKSGTSWTKTAKIPIPNPERYDDVFGYSFATDGQQLAIGAPGFEEAGRVFIYEPSDAGWTQWQLDQEIDLTSLTPEAYGDHLAMTSDWLVIPYVMNGTIQNSLAIFQKTGSAWTFFQTLEVGFLGFYKETTMDVDIDGETIVCGPNIIQRNAAGQWEVKYYLSPSDPESIQIAPDFSHWITDGSTFGISVAIDGDNIFIGAPTKDNGSTWNVGAVYVFTRQPGFEWSSMTETTKILPRVKDEMELFGYTLDVLYNTLIVGAPGADYNKDGVTARNKPGRAFIYQSQDYYWQNVTALMDFTGDTFVKDYFGFTVGLDSSNFIIGAPIEDIETGALSGSVYVAPSPPIVKLVPPVCSASSSIDLFGYPFGGLWNGPGITDATEGIFSPAVVGVGTHIFEYRTPSCTYVGKLMIEVNDPPMVSNHSPTTVGVCKDAYFINSTLSVSSNATKYQWYYRAAQDHDFTPLMEYGSSMVGTQRGEYFPNLSNSGCTIQGPVFTIQNDNIEVVIDEIPQLCVGETMSLKVTPEGGIWRGDDMAGSLFQPTQNGTYTITYIYVSPAGCSYAKTASANVVAPPSVFLSREGDLCKDNEVTLTANVAADDASLEWFYKDPDSGQFQPLNDSGMNLTVNANGMYMVTAKVGSCSPSSDKIVLSDYLVLSFNEDALDLRVCKSTSKELAVNPVNEAEYQWLFSKSPYGDYSAVSSSSKLKVNETGYYQAHVTTPSCFAMGPVFHIEILPGDTLIAPNVFTPNGDGWNDQFAVQVGSGNSQMVILNRYGNEVFSGSTTRPWDGGNSPSGVYFWIANGDGCEGDKKTARGYVQLVR